MAKDPTAAFFAALAERGHEPLLQSESGTIRFDARDGRRTEHWYITLKKGDVAVSHKNADANTVVRLDKATLDALVTGRANATTAVLRGELEFEGDLGLVMSFQRLFPAPPKSVYARRIK